MQSEGLGRDGLRRSNHMSKAQEQKKHVVAVLMTVVFKAHASHGMFGQLALAWETVGLT